MSGNLKFTKRFLNINFIYSTQIYFKCKSITN